MTWERVCPRWPWGGCYLSYFLPLVWARVSWRRSPPSSRAAGLCQRCCTREIRVIFRPNFSCNGSHIDRPVHACDTVGSGNAVDTLMSNGARWPTGLPCRNFWGGDTRPTGLGRLGLSTKDVQWCHRLEARVCQLVPISDHRRSVDRRSDHRRSVDRRSDHRRSMGPGATTEGTSAAGASSEGASNRGASAAGATAEGAPNRGASALAEGASALAEGASTLAEGAAATRATAEGA